MSLSTHYLLLNNDVVHLPRIVEDFRAFWVLQFDLRAFNYIAGLKSTHEFFVCIKKLDKLECQSLKWDSWANAKHLAWSHWRQIAPGLRLLC